MAISLRAAGTSTTSGDPADTAPAYPAGGQAGDINVLTVVAKPYSSTITTPSGWSKVGEATDGTTASGVNTGSVKVAVYTRTGAFSGSVTLAFSGAQDAVAVINTYACASGDTWDTTGHTAGAGALSTSYSATGAANINAAAGDWIIAASANASASISSSTWAITATGLTLGTLQLRQSNYGAYFNNCRLIYADRPVTSGTESAAPVFSFTNTETCNGETFFLRLRAETPPTDVSDSDTGSCAEGLASRSSAAADTGTGTEATSGHTLTGADIGTVADAGTASTVQLLSSADTGHAAESTGSVTVIPGPPITYAWKPGDPTSASVLNAQWRALPRWFLGDDRPFFEAYNSDHTYTFVSGDPVPLHTETYKRGGMTHATDASGVTLPMAGVYQGIVTLACDMTGASGITMLGAELHVNGSVVASQTTPIKTISGVWSIVVPFTQAFDASDYLEIAMTGGWGAGQVCIPASYAYSYPRLSVWWRGNT